MSRHKHRGERGKEALHPNKSKYPTCLSTDTNPRCLLLLIIGTHCIQQFLNRLTLPEGLVPSLWITLSCGKACDAPSRKGEGNFFKSRIYNANVLKKSIKMSDFCFSLYHYRYYKPSVRSQHSRMKRWDDLEPCPHFPSIIWCRLLQRKEPQVLMAVSFTRWPMPTPNRLWRQSGSDCSCERACARLSLPSSCVTEKALTKPDTPVQNLPTHRPEWAAHRGELMFYINEAVTNKMAVVIWILQQDNVCAGRRRGDRHPVAICIYLK